MTNHREPKAWMVYCAVGCEFDYRVFVDRSEAVDEIDKQVIDGHEQPDLIPLFAGKPMRIDD